MSLRSSASKREQGILARAVHAVAEQAAKASEIVDEALAACSSPDPRGITEAMCPDRGDGRPIDPDAFGKAFRAAVAACGLNGIRLHDLRHGFASMMIAAGTQARMVSDLLGHATVGFTLQVYTHPNDQDAAMAADTAERLCGPAMGGQ